MLDSGVRYGPNQARSFLCRSPATFGMWGTVDTRSDSELTFKPYVPFDAFRHRHPAHNRERNPLLHRKIFKFF
jgi:hypothetical protein